VGELFLLGKWLSERRRAAHPQDNIWGAQRWAFSMFAGTLHVDFNKALNSINNSLSWWIDKLSLFFSMGNRAGECPRLVTPGHPRFILARTAPKHLLSLVVEAT